MKLLTALFLWIYSLACFAGGVVNVYGWGGEIPDSVMASFEKETGIKVNFSSYDNNETLFAKLQMSHGVGYDVVMPSSYYVARMSKAAMLHKLDLSKLPNMKHLDPYFLNRDFDPKNQYSLPFTWGITGILINNKMISRKDVQGWNDLWKPQFANQLLLLDDTREIFSMVLLSMGYNLNDQDPQHIQQAYEKLLRLLPNIKLYAVDSTPTIYADEDADVGMIWNGDAYQAYQDNQNLSFIYPNDGFVVWVDNFSIVANAPNLENAYQFINYMLRPEMAKIATLSYGHATTNLSARKLLPLSIQNNSTLYPSAEVLSHGHFQNDVSNEALNLYEKYWELLKLHS